MLNYQNYNHCSSRFCISCLCQLLHSGVLEFFLFTCLDPLGTQSLFKIKLNPGLPKLSPVISPKLFSCCYLLVPTVQHMLENHWSPKSQGSREEMIPCDSSSAPGSSVCRPVNSSAWNMLYSLLEVFAAQKWPCSGILVMDCIGSTKPQREISLAQQKCWRC